MVELPEGHKIDENILYSKTTLQTLAMSSLNSHYTHLGLFEKGIWEFKTLLW